MKTEEVNSADNASCNQAIFHSVCLIGLVIVSVAVVLMIAIIKFMNSKADIIINKAYVNITGEFLEKSFMFICPNVSLKVENML